jgi:uncharacterized membrane protein YdjX (TVP38/TMEM64 family)
MPQIAPPPSSEVAPPSGRSDAGGSTASLLRLAPLVVVLLAMAMAVYFGLHRELTLESIVHHQMSVESTVMAHKPLAITTYIIVFIAVVALSIPGTAVLMITGGLLFGTVIGSLAAVFAATAGATIVFIITSGVIGERLFKRAGPRVIAIAQGFREDAFSYLVFLRVVPLFPFWIVNLVPAFCGVPLRTFVMATVIGIIPLAIIGAFFGASLVDAVSQQQAMYKACVAAGQAGCKMEFDITAAFTPRIIAALVALGLAALLPVIVKRIRVMRSKKLEAQ